MKMKKGNKPSKLIKSAQPIMPEETSSAAAVSPMFKKGGKVEGGMPKMRLDKPMRKFGGAVSSSKICS